MCILAWNWQPGTDMPLLLVGNRDEFYARPTQALHWWPDLGDGALVLAGRDLQGGGSWLGISRTGRLAALTNVRDPGNVLDTRPSRGTLVSDFLSSDISAADYVATLAKEAAVYNPFNLLVCDGPTLWGLHSPSGKARTLEPGVGAVSNADFGTPWPKLRTLHAGLQTQIAQGQTEGTQLLPLLQNRAVAPDALLPHTGVPLALERALSATFIATPDYGTRASSVVRIGRTHAAFLELRYDFSGPLGSQHLQFAL